MRLLYAPLAALPLALAACEINIDDDDGSADTGAADTGADESSDGADETGEPTGPQTCADVDRSEMAEQPPTGEAEITLSGVYRVSGRLIYDNDEVVTIEPGTIFLMESDASMTFGWRNDPATVFAMGTADQPILLCGTEPGPGHWANLQMLGGTASESTLDHVRIEDGGQGGVPAFLQHNEHDLNQITITGNEGPGFEIDGLGASSDGMFVTNNGGVSGMLDGETAISNLPAGDYTGNGEDVLMVTGLDNTNAVFHERGVPYRQVADRVVFGSADGTEASITMEAGVVYQFCQDCFMIVGWRNDPGVVQLLGTENQPVVLTSSQASPAPGDWNGLQLAGGTRSNSRIENTRIEYGGKSDDQGNLVINGGLGTIENNTLANSAGWGIFVDGDREAGLTIGTNDYVDNALGAVSDE